MNHQRAESRSAGLLLLAVVASIGGCHSETPLVEEYLLAAQPRSTSTTAVERGKLPALRVVPLQARGFLDRTAVAWREGAVRSGAYLYRRWSEPPAETMTRLLIDALRERGEFAQVDGSATRTTGRLTLQGELLGLHEATDEQGLHPVGVVELELTLDIEPVDSAAAPQRAILRAKSEEPAVDETMGALIRALSVATGRVLDQLCDQVAAAAAHAAE